jgi:prepilin-type N-terminal cleavage/methylation domain-containing protein
VLKRGFTLVELLVVIAIIGILISQLLLSVTQQRGEQCRAAASTQTDTLAQAEEAFVISHGQYGTLSQLIADGLVPSDLSDDEKDGYRFVIDIDPPPLPEFRILADPIVPPLGVSFFVDQTGVVRYELDGPADASSTVFSDVASIPTPQAELVLQAQLEAEGGGFVLDLGALPGSGEAIQSAVDLLATGAITPSAVLATLDDDSNGSVSIQEFLAADVLALARSLKVGLGLSDDGTSIGNDATLVAMIEGYKALLDGSFQPNVELVAPEVAYGAGLAGDPEAFLLQVLASALPATGTLGALLLAAALGELARRRLRTGRDATG